MAVTPPVEPQGPSRKEGTSCKCSKPTKGHRIKCVMNSQMKQAINPKQDCSFYVMLETQKEDNAAEMIYMYPLAGMGHFCHNL